jgi:hypothetical protein
MIYNLEVAAIAVATCVRSRPGLPSACSLNQGWIFRHLAPDEIVESARQRHSGHRTGLARRHPQPHPGCRGEPVDCARREPHPAAFEARDHRLRRMHAVGSWSDPNGWWISAGFSGFATVPNIRFLPLAH